MTEPVTDTAIDPAIDFASEELLDGLEGTEREARLRLLERLHKRGVTLDELRSSTTNNTLMFLDAERMIGGGAYYTPTEVAEQAGIDIEYLGELQRASGIAQPSPDEPSLGPGDLELAKIAGRYVSIGVPREDVIEITRVLAHGLGQAAETMRTTALKLALAPGATEDELALDFTAVAAELIPMIEPLLGEMMRLQLRTMARTEVINAAEREAGVLPGAREVGVCFADIVDFTRAGEELPPDEIGHLATALERHAARTLEAPVRLVKSLGDAVMLVSPEVPALVDAALALVEASEIESSGLSQLRAGIAMGPALSRAADWYGRPVNLASRVTAIARPGSVLATGPVREALGDSYKWSFAGARRFKGIRESVPLYRVRRLTDTDEK